MKFLLQWIMNILWWDWAHVGIFILDPERTTEKVFVHCFESRWGSRRIRLINKERYPIPNWKQYLLKHNLYQIQIYPWLTGARDSNIPTYTEATSKKGEFVSKLKGNGRILNDDTNK